jgi:N-acetylmuramoyl-L-alanine amidase
MVLKLGSKGDRVRHIQLLLNIKQDGLFGKQTQTAVKEFQISNNLVPDGIVGIKTLDALESLDSQSNQIINKI